MMENWKEQVDDEGRSFIEFLREQEQKIICVACSKPVADKDDFNALQNIYSHTRSIEHGFKMFIMINLKEMEVVDLTANCDEKENCCPKPKQTHVEITRNGDGSLKISGVNPIKYVVPIVDLPFMKNNIYTLETTSRKNVLMSLDNFVTKVPSKRNETERDLSVPSAEQVILFIHILFI